MMYQVIQTGSDGNAVIYNESILVDGGVPFTGIEPFLSGLRLVLLTHEHGDHFRIATIRKMAFERPSLRFGCGAFLADKLSGLTNNIDVYEAGKVYDYGMFKISPVTLYHDVMNFGYRIFIGDYKIFHATDTAHLKGITAKGYDLYSLEANYDEETVGRIIADKYERGEYAHQIGSMNSHLSHQQALNFILNNAVRNYEFLPLHQSKEC